MGLKFPCMYTRVERLDDLIRSTQVHEHHHGHKAQRCFLKSGQWPKERKNECRINVRVCEHEEELWEASSNIGNITEVWSHLQFFCGLRRFSCNILHCINFVLSWHLPCQLGLIKYDQINWLPNNFTHWCLNYGHFSAHPYKTFIHLVSILALATIVSQCQDAQLQTTSLTHWKLQFLWYFSA